MTPGLIPAALLALAILFFSGLYVLRLKVSRTARIAVFCARAALVTCLVLAFVEPTMRFSRVGHPDASTLILIDNSRSMSLFSPDSAIAIVGRSLARSGVRATIAVFGDSLARIASLGEATFSAPHTRFPPSLAVKGFERQRRVLIVSDGNWQDAGSFAEKLEDRECGYLVLSAIRPRPFLMAQAVPRSIDCIEGKPVRIPIQLTAYAPHRRHLLIESSAPGNVDGQKHMLDSGFSADTVLVSIAARQPGRHLVTLRITDAADSISTSCGLIQTVEPDTLAVRLNAPAPDLDARFLLLGLKRAGTWRTLDAGRKPYDLLITFSLDPAFDSLLAGLAPAGVILAIGALPCNNALTLIAPSVGAILGNSAFPASDRGSDAGRLPPLSSIIRCPDAAGYRRDPNSLLVTVTNARGSADTVPLVYQTMYRNKPLIAMAGRGFWRWDFLPLAFSESESDQNAFSSLMLSMARSRIIMNLSNRFIVFPEQLPLLSSAPIALSVWVPATIADQTAGTIRIRLLDRARVALDTTESITVSGAAATGISVAALKPGRYLIDATLAAAGLSAAYHDSLSIEEDNAELRVLQQNTALLEQAGRRIALNDSAVTMFLTAPSAASREAATETTEIPIRQSWWLLGCIGALFALEWILRRRWLVD